MPTHHKIIGTTTKKVEYGRTTHPIMVEVDEYLQLHTTFDGQEITAYTPQGLEDAVKEAIRKKRVKKERDIRVVMHYEKRYVRATLRGVHAKTGDTLVTLRSGKNAGEKVQVHSPDLLAMDDQVTDEQIDKLNAMIEEIEQKQKALWDYTYNTVRQRRSEPTAWRLLEQAEKEDLEALKAEEQAS